MSSEIKQRDNLQEISAPTPIWLRRLIIALTFLVWMVIIGVCIWLLWHTTQVVVLLLLGVTIATVVSPLVNGLNRVMPRLLAIAIVYSFVFCGLGILCYFIINIIINQLISLIQYILSFMNTNGDNSLRPFIHTLQQFGILPNLRSLGQQIIALLQRAVNNLLLVVSNLFTFLLNLILVILLSIYFLMIGPRTSIWLRQKTPLVVREQANFLLDTLNRIIGRNFRGELFLATLISIITGVGLYFIGVPYPILISILAFTLEFIPIIGFYITAIAILLAALTKGWIIALIALAFVSILRSIEGDILAPRILGSAVGINPIISIAAMIAGIDLFGIVGAFFAAPAAGAIQAIIAALWDHWKRCHPEQFPQEESTKPPSSPSNNHKTSLLLETDSLKEDSL